MNTNNTQNTLMDSPEALGHALCNLLPEMVQGFRVVKSAYPHRRRTRLY